MLAVSKLDALIWDASQLSQPDLIQLGARRLLVVAAVADAAGVYLSPELRGAGC